MNKPTLASTSAEIDKVIGRNLRIIRHAKKMSQPELGEILGISFQQIQKYEMGDNRLSASALYQISEALGVSISEFFSELTPGNENVKFEDWIATPQDYKFLTRYRQLPQNLKKSIERVLETLSKA